MYAQRAVKLCGLEVVKPQSMNTVLQSQTGLKAKHSHFLVIWCVSLNVTLIYEYKKQMIDTQKHIQM